MKNPFTLDRSIDPADRAMAVRLAVMTYMLKGGAIAIALVSAVVIFIYALKFISTFLPEDPYAAAPIAPPVQLASVSGVACFSGCPTPVPVHIDIAADAGCVACHTSTLAAIKAPSEV